MTWATRRVRLVLTIVLLWIAAPPFDAQAESRLAADAIIEADADTVEALLATFTRAEAAIANRDLAGIMALYSDRYSYHGLTRVDIAKIWGSLFDDYRLIEDQHTFSVLRVKSTGRGFVAEITCSGALWATAERSGLRVPIDSWHEEVHQLVREDGVWRIYGNAGEAPKVLPFGTAPHPLF